MGLRKYRANSILRGRVPSGFEFKGVGMSGFILSVSCVSFGTLKLPITLLLKFMLLEYWEERGVNQTLVKVMFQ